jgi:hypothetical protein
VQERDAAGNYSASASLAIVIDLTAPNSPTFAGSTSSPTNLTTPTWAWGSGGGAGNGTYRIKLDNTDLTTGATTVTVDAELVPGTFTVKGSVKKVNGVTVVLPSVNVSGTGYLQGANRSDSANLKYALRIDTANKLLMGHGNGKASASGLGTATIDEDILYPLPSGMDGIWTLSLDVQTTGTKLAGTAPIQLSNGRMPPFDLNGSYSATTDMSKIKLKGTVNGADDATGSKLGLLTSGSAAVLDAVAGKALGQTFAF